VNKAKDEARCWKLWLRTRAQRVAAFAVLLMSVLGVFGGHQSHLHREVPIIPTTTNRLIASGNTTPVTASFTHNFEGLTPRLDSRPWFQMKSCEIDLFACSESPKPFSAPELRDPLTLASCAPDGTSSMTDRICRYRCRMFPCAIRTTHYRSQSTAYWQFL